MNVELLSHEAFIKVLQWDLIQTVHGTYLEQLAREYAFLRETKDLYGFLPKRVYNEINNLRKNWARYALLSRHVCVDVTTGEVYEPTKS